MTHEQKLRQIDGRQIAVRAVHAHNAARHHHEPEATIVPSGRLEVPRSPDARRSTRREGIRNKRLHRNANRYPPSLQTHRHRNAAAHLFQTAPRHGAGIARTLERIPRLAHRNRPLRPLPCGAILPLRPPAIHHRTRRRPIQLQPRPFRNRGNSARKRSEGMIYMSKLDCICDVFRIYIIRRLTICRQNRKLLAIFSSRA